MNRSDAELVRESLSGSPGADEAFSQLVARYRPSVFGLAFAATGTATEAEDLTQETLIAAYLSLPHLRNPDRFGEWLKGIARNLLRMWYRRHAATPTLDGGHVLEDLDDGSFRAPEERLDQQESLSRIREAVKELSAGNQQAINLRYWAEMSYSEIGATLNVPVSTVKSRLHKAKRQLQALLPDKRVERRIEMIPVTVGELYTQKTEALPAEAVPYVIVSLNSEDGRSLPIWLGPGEATWIAISRVLEDGELMRPLTFDLVANMLAKLGVKVDQIVVSALKNETFYAVISFTSGQVQHEIDARPSDAINLAIRTGAPMYVADEVMAAAGKAVPEELPDEVQPFELPAWIQRQLSELRQVKEA